MKEHPGSKTDNSWRPTRSTNTNHSDMMLKLLNCYDSAIVKSDQTQMEDMDREQGRRIQRIRRIRQICLRSYSGAEGIAVPHLTLRNAIAGGAIWVFVHLPDLIQIAACIAAVSFFFSSIESLLDTDVSTHEVEMEVLQASKRLHEVMQS